VKGPELFIGIVAPVGIDLTMMIGFMEEAFSDLSYKCKVLRLSKLLSEVPRYKKLKETKDGFEDERIQYRVLKIWKDICPNSVLNGLMIIIMYLINAIYFKGTWTYEFDKDETLDDYFNTLNGNQVPCKLMVQTKKCLCLRLILSMMCF